MEKSDMQTSPTTRALIIAAGQGTRLSAQADLKPLIRIRGVPLIQRVIEQGVNAGLCEFYVTVGYQHQRLEEFLVQLREQLGVAITTIHNPHWQLGNGSSVLAARAHLEPPFVLMMADHLIEPRLVRTLTAHSLARDQVMLAVDRDLDNSWVDLDDVTRVRTREGRIKAIGKQLSDFDCYDTGVFHCSAGLFDALQVSARAGRHNLSDAIQTLADQGLVSTVDIHGAFWIDIDSPNMMALAEQWLQNPRNPAPAAVHLDQNREAKG
ncbi:MAG: NTP transferase domain-containing protein [Sedimenticola sp.]